MDDAQNIEGAGAAGEAVRALREARGLTLAALGERIGLSKSKVHQVESTGRASLPVALAIEELSGGRIDAADLCDDVRAARHRLVDTAAQHGAPTGQSGDLSGAEARGEVA